MKNKILFRIRKLHRWGGLVNALPLLIVIISGIILQVKNEFEWIQPPIKHGKQMIPTISFDKILDIMISVPEAEVSSWDDINRMDVRPNLGVIKIQCKNHWEIQLDSHTGEVLQTAFRRSEIIEAIHVGSWFHPKAKLWIFLPSAFILFGLWITGIVLLISITITRKLRIKRRHVYKEVK